MIYTTEKIQMRERSFLFDQHKFLQGNNVNKFKPIIYEMFFNISIQYVNIRFAENMKVSSAKLEHEIRLYPNGNKCIYSKVHYHVR